MSEAASRTGSPWFATFLSRPTSGDVSPAQHGDRAWKRKRRCMRFAFSSSARLTGRILSVLCRPVSRGTLRDRANVCPRTKSIHWRGDLTCSAVAQPAPGTGATGIYLWRFLSAQCTDRKPIPAGRVSSQLSSRSDSRSYSLLRRISRLFGTGKPRRFYGHAFSKKMRRQSR